MKSRSMRGLDFKKFRPALVLIEDGCRDLDKHRYLRQNGYKLVKRTTLNNWYIPQDEPFHLDVLAGASGALPEDVSGFAVSQNPFNVLRRRANE